MPELISPLTHIFNSCLDRNEYPLLWKTARISPIPKIDEPRTDDYYRPTSILPVLSIIIYNISIIFLRKCHFTTTTMLAIRADMLKAMKRGEITLALMTDFSKAFDTVAFEKVLSKLHLMGFSRTTLQWIASYLTVRATSRTGYLISCHLIGLRKTKTLLRPQKD